MSHAYEAVGWNRQKRLYDLVVVGGVVAYLTAFALVSLLLRPEITLETLLIRGFGTCALLLLHVVLSIGPLCRLDRRFLPLLYNRRHLGVVMFLTALAHGGLSIVQFHSLGEINPLVSVLVSGGRLDSLAWLPFEPLGLAALVILFLMAATSHDFWLANLTPPVWKALHMSVYVAYGLILLHVTFGALQSERHPVLPLLLLAGLLWIVGLHWLAGHRERRTDVELARDREDGFVPVCRVDEIPQDRAKIVTLSGERVAVFRYDGKISALSNVCRHQNGPLGEGVVRDGCVVCPWHGFEYVPHTGASPPPFTETVPTFDVRVRDDRVLVDPRPNPPGTPTEPAPCRESTARSVVEFYVGYVARAPDWVAEFLRPRLGAAALLALLLAGVLAAAQRPFASSRFEYQTFRSFEGTIIEEPYGMLLVDRPGLTAASGPFSVYPLTVFGKHGAQGVVRNRDGTRVQIEGELIYRGGDTMLQVRDGSVRESGSGSQTGREPIGEIVVEGEIVDSKCFLGVMKPAREKPHRACATLCIRGGIPPMLVTRTSEGRERNYLLTGPEGEAIGREVLALVAEPVRVSGRVLRIGDTWLLATDPSAIERLR